MSHELKIPASHYSAFDERLIPLGAPDHVNDTVFDFRSRQIIGQIDDHRFCLDAGRGDLHLGAKVCEPESGRAMEVWKTEPAIQLYTASHFSEAMVAPFSKMVLNVDIALEPQAYPNAPNEPTYPSAVLRRGETYHHQIEWRFSGF